MLNMLLDSAPTNWYEALAALRNIQSGADLDLTRSLVTGGLTWRAGDIMLRNGSLLSGATAVLLVTEVYADGLRAMGFIVRRNSVEIKADWRMSASFLADCSKPVAAPFRPAVRKL